MTNATVAEQGRRPGDDAGLTSGAVGNSLRLPSIGDVAPRLDLLDGGRRGGTSPDGLQPLDKQFWSSRRRGLAQITLAYARDLDDTSISGIHNMIGILTRAMRLEKSLGAAGHFAAMTPRYHAQRRALRDQQSLLRRLEAEAV